MDDNSPNLDTARQIKELARTLFAEGLSPPLPDTDHLELIKDSKVITSEYIDQLIKDGNEKQEKLANFVQDFGKKSSEKPYLNSSTAEEFLN